MTQQYAFFNTVVKLSEGEEILYEVRGGARSLGTFGLLKHYILRHRRSLLLTTKRVVYLSKATRDVSTKTTALKDISSIDVSADSGFLRAIGAVLLFFIGVIFVFAGLGLGSSSEQDVPIAGQVLSMVLGVWAVIRGILGWKTRASTAIEIESTGGSRTVFNADGVSQRNAITEAVEHINSMRL